MQDQAWFQKLVSKMKTREFWQNVWDVLRSKPAQWVYASFCILYAILALSQGGVFSFLLFSAATLLLMPIAPIRTWLKAKNLKNRLVAAIAAAVCFVGLVCFPVPKVDLDDLKLPESSGMLSTEANEEKKPESEPEAEPEVEPESESEPEPAPEEHVHEWSKTTTEATCTKKGEVTETCACGEEKRQEIEALGHSFGNWETSQEPTVYAQGERTRFCERCDYEERASIPKLEPEPEPEPEPDPEPQQETMVWISGSGSKYHSNSSCSGMKNPSRVPISQAEAAGRSPCKKCY